MKVVLATSAGFCLGVRRAVEMALAAAREAGGRVYSDGPLVHNSDTLRALAAGGVCVADDASRGLPPGATVVVRAHGVSPERRRALAAACGRLVDATCPDVARIQGIVRARVARGGFVVILGDPDHAEVAGLLGHAGARGAVVASVADVAALPGVAGPVTLVAQSTQDEEAFAEVAVAVRERFPGAEAIDTVCEATRRRRAELRTLAPRVGAFVVVGSPRSANSRRLAEFAARLRPTSFVRGADDVRPADFAGCAAVGLTAGASTPDSTLQAVRRRLEALPATPRPAIPPSSSLP